MLVVLPGSVLITWNVPELAFFEPSSHYHLQEDKATRGGGALFLVSVTMHDLI